MATMPRTTIQSHQRLLAGSVAEESRAPRSGSSIESRWPIRSLLAIIAYDSSESAGARRQGFRFGVPVTPFEPTGKADLRTDTLDGFREQMVTKAPFLDGWSGLEGWGERRCRGIERGLLGADIILVGI